jgi:hypothetical protein
MLNREYSKLMPGDALRRSSSAPKIVVIGPSTSGKSTLVYLLVNHRIIGFLSVGIGDKSQTTIIPCNFAFDMRIEKDEYFALQIKRKVFAAKEIHIIVMEALSKLFCANSCDPEETLEALDEDWMMCILEPEKANYHLGCLKDVIDFELFKEIVGDILSDIDELGYDEKVKIRKKELQGQKIKIADVRAMVFEECWDMLEEEATADYRAWLQNIGAMIENKLIALVGESTFNEEVLELSVEADDKLSDGTHILGDLFDPFKPYSLIIDEITMSCRPRKELINIADQSIPLRFCLRDTMGMTQIGMDAVSIKSALDAAMNCSPDSILFLLSLEERDDTLTECCNALSEKFDKAEKVNVPVYLLFTKADRIIGNLINKGNKNSIELRQEDYDTNMSAAIKVMEQSIDKFSTKIPKESVNWLSLRYLEEKIDPIQIALHNIHSDAILNFKPNGLYKRIDKIVRGTQKRILPEGIDKPLFITAINSAIPAVNITVDADGMKEVIGLLSATLSEDKAVVNGYVISDNTPRLSGRSVVAYWNKLKIGLGHTTKANVFGNFSINMKGMLSSVLNRTIPDFITLYEAGVISTTADNLKDEELQALVNAMDPEEEYRDMAFYSINPALVNAWSDREKNTQVLHLIFRTYFAQSGRYAMVMDRVAYQLSYGNNIIKDMLNQIYNSPDSYDEIMRDMQMTFKNDIFEEGMLKTLFINELNATMTELVNKMFITI